MMRRHRMPVLARQEAGFGAILAIIALVMLSAMGAAILRMSWTQQMSDAEDVSSARAQQAANAGVDWGLYQALQGSWSSCSSASQTLDMRSSHGVWVTVTCSSSAYVEGLSEDTGGTQNAQGSVVDNKSVTVYTITATACNGTSSCPDSTAATSTGYIERQRQAQITN